MSKKADIVIEPIDGEEQSRKTVLVAILGTAPAVLTEAVWALAVKDGVVPDRIVVMTTATGKERLYEQVIRGGIWEKLKKDLASEGIDIKGKLVFNDIFLKMFYDEQTGEPVEDLPTRASNLHAANQMMECIRHYTDNHGWRVYGLMAGGRKTMTGLFFSVMSLLARRGDRIFHVLVSEPFENPRLSPLFFYPQKDVSHELVVDGTKRTYDSLSAEVNLFEVPFVAIGEWVEQKCRAVSSGQSYEGLISSVEQCMDRALEPQVAFDLLTGDLLVDEAPMRLAETEFVFLIFLARRGTHDLALKDTVDFGEFIDDIGQDAMDDSSCLWLQKFYGKEEIPTGMFFRLNIKNADERAKQLKSDRSKVVNRLRDKLVKHNSWFADERGKLRLPPLEKFGILHREAVHDDIYERFFPDKIAKD